MAEVEVRPAAAPPASAVEELLRCAEVSKRFGTTTALDRVSLELAPGETLSVVGPSGCGKSTLLRVIAGLDDVDAGIITLNGRTVSGHGAFLPPERRGVGIVFQDLALFPHLSVADNVGFGLRHGTGTRAAAGDRVARMLELLGISDKAERFPHQLSGGEQQRVAIGRALALEPAMVLLDEPFSHLDKGISAAVRDETMQTLRRAGATVVLVTHDQGEAMAVADRVAVMRAGQLVQVDRPAVVFHEPVDEITASFLGEADFVDGLREGSVAHTALGPLGVRPGPDGPVRVLVRPHHLSALPYDSTTAASGSRATVQTVEFRGGDVLHVLRLDTGETVRARLAHSAALRVGDRAVVPRPSETPLVAFPADDAPTAADPQ